MNKLNKKIILAITAILIIIIATIFIVWQQTANQFSLYSDQNFSLKIPANWTLHDPGATSILMLKNPQEIITDPHAQKLNFRSYISVSQRQTYGRTLEQIIDFLIRTEIQTGQNAQIINHSTTKINQADVQLIEAAFSQQNMPLRVYLAVAIDKEKYYVLSTYTTADKWQAHKDLFLQTIQSFKLSPS